MRRASWRWLADEVSADLYAARNVPAMTGSERAGHAPGRPDVALPLRDADILRAAATREESDSDFTKAMKTLLALHFDDHDIAHWHAGMLALETQALLSGPRAQRPAVQRRLCVLKPAVRVCALLMRDGDAEAHAVALRARAILLLRLGRPPLVVAWPGLAASLSTPAAG